jgi:hypothetical protein
VRQQGRLFLYRAVNLISGEMGIAGFNDHNTHEEVMAAWDKARELALA